MFGRIAVVLGSLTIAVATSAARYATPEQGGAIKFVLAPTGNEVRYRVHEQLANVDLPGEAIGKTPDVTGGIVIARDGKVVAAESKFVVNVTTLKSDRERRDGYIQRRTLETEQYPTVELLPTALRGLTLPLPTSGSKTFELVGDLKVRTTTRPTTWQVTATFAPGKITGTATTAFTFDEMGLTKPRVASVLSVADSIKLEYDFTLVTPRP